MNLGTSDKNYGKRFSISYETQYIDKEKGINFMLGAEF